MHDCHVTRRALITAGIGSLVLLPGLASGQEKKAGQEEDVSPAEDLMREHGVLKRALLVYDECAARLNRGETPPPNVIADTANLIRTFIEEYHEKLEEDYLFPRFRKAKTLVSLVDVLETQHKAGRTVTARILASVKTMPKDQAGRLQLATLLREFTRMYAPHETREDTVLFPALHRIVSPHEYDELGDEFEKKEHQLFGEKGFEQKVEEIAKIEQAIGIYELAQFTPKV